ncbi:MAG: response regulator [Chloroflexi bacterium]|nr:response regulator [Chloroflexota bacterium]
MSAKKRVMVVDDEPGILRFVRTILDLAGYDVITTTSGEESLQLAQSQPVDIIILDILMQPLSGFDVLEKLRTFSKVPVIVFTAQREIAEAALKEGADGYIEKPFRPEQLTRKIQDVLDKQAATGTT